MKIQTSEPDIETLVKRIERNDVNLQPDFQRGEVWSERKKILLVDSILRGWQIPPVHVVQRTVGGAQEVLDGQQRLSAIRSFARGDFAVNGNIKPLDARIQGLDGLHYLELPKEERRQFDNFTIRLITITDFSAEEPAELFYRLNQPVHLTTAEQRNAFFGPAREQVKVAAKLLATTSLGDSKIAGFSNARLAVDDVIAKAMLAIETKTLTRKIGAPDLESRYRSNQAFNSRTTEGVAHSIDLIDRSIKKLAMPPAFNKATLLTWLVLGDQCSQLKLKEDTLVAAFDTIRELDDLRREGGLAKEYKLDVGILIQLQDYYNDRSSSRVADVSSVLIRHAVGWALIYNSRQDLAAPIGSRVSQFVSGFVEFKNKRRVDAVTLDALARPLGELI